MALQAEERLVLHQQVVGNRTVWIVADGAVVFNRGVTEHERTLVAAVAVEAEIVGALVGGQFTVRIVAVAAAHLALFDRVMRGEVGLGHLLLVAGVAELGILLLQGGLVPPCMLWQSVQLTSLRACWLCVQSIRLPSV